MTLATLLSTSLALAQVYPTSTEIDFDTWSIIAERPEPAGIVIVSAPRDDAGACADLLALGLPELPSVEALGTRSGRRQLGSAARAAEMAPEERELVLARAHTCFAWTFGDRTRTTAGLYAWFVRDADLGYCREHVVGYDGLGAEDDADRTALDDAAAFSEYCAIDPAAPPLRRNPYERVQTALSEARLGGFVEGGAARELFERVARRSPVTEDGFLAVLRDIDASGAPAAAFVAGESDRVWKAREVERAARERLSSGG